MADPTRKVMLTVAAHARDADDCRELLAMLGITPPKPKRSPGRPSVDRGHGAPSTYKKGCRCAACRDANRLHHAELRAKWKTDPSGADRAGHGRASTYKNHGCRCVECKAANRADCAERRARRRERALAAEVGGA